MIHEAEDENEISMREVLSSFFACGKTEALIFLNMRGNVSSWCSELIVILIIALIIFWPNKLPEIGKAFGKAIAEFRGYARGTDDKTESEKASASKTEA